MIDQFCLFLDIYTDLSLVVTDRLRNVSLQTHVDSTAVVLMAAFMGHKHLVFASKHVTS